jgi:hypothetical protein
MKGLVLFEVGFVVSKYGLKSQLEETSGRNLQCRVWKTICPMVEALLVCHRRHTISAEGVPSYFFVIKSSTRRPHDLRSSWW